MEIRDSDYRQCIICDKEVKQKRKEVYIHSLFLYLLFHQDCWEEAGGEMQTGFSTVKAWNEFAGKQYEISGRYLLTKSDGMWYYLKN